VPTNVPFPYIETFAQDGTPLGPIITLFGKIWNNQEKFHQPGMHTVPVADHVLIDVADNRFHVKLEAHVKVERCFYLGPLPVEMTGFRDEQTGSLSADHIRTAFIEPTLIESGKMPGWVQLQTDKEIAIEVMIVLDYVDALPESADELKSEPPSGAV